MRFVNYLKETFLNNFIYTSGVALFTFGSLYVIAKIFEFTYNSFGQISAGIVALIGISAFLAVLKVWSDYKE